MTHIEAEKNRQYAKVTRMLISSLKEEKAKNAQYAAFAKKSVNDAITAKKHDLWDQEAIGLVQQNRSRLCR